MTIKLNWHNKSPLKIRSNLFSQCKRKITKIVFKSLDLENFSPLNYNFFIIISFTLNIVLKKYIFLDLIETLLIQLQLGQCLRNDWIVKNWSRLFTTYFSFYFYFFLIFFLCINSSSIFIFDKKIKKTLKKRLI